MPIRKIKAGLVLTKEVDEFIGEDGNIFYDVDTNGDLTLRLSDGVTPGGVAMASGGGGTSRLNVVGDDSSGSLLNLASGTPDLKFTGTGGVTVSVADDIVTIDGSGVSGSGGTLSMFGDDSTNMEVDLATQDLQVSGGNSITTSTSSTQTLTVSLDDEITVNKISSADSTAVFIDDNLLPDADGTYDLGSPLRQWNRLFVTGNTIYLGDLILQSVGSNSEARLVVKNRIDGRTVTDIDPNADYDSEGAGGTTNIVGMLKVVSDDSTGASLNSHETIKFRGGTNVTVTVDDDSTVGEAIVTINSTGGGALTDATELQLGTPTDSSTFPVGAIDTLTPTHTVTDSIDDLNEALENVRNDTFVKSVEFVADQTSGGAGLVVTLTITAVGNANAFDVTWGDGTTDIGTTDTTPSHTYSTNSGSPFSVTVRAYNTSGEGTGSEATSTRTDYITIFTANPSVAFAFYANPTGGSTITKADLGATVYLQNNTTNTTGATATFTIDWGDGVTEQIAANDDAGGVDGARLAHTYDRPDAGDSSTTLVGDGDLRFNPRLTLVTHNTAAPDQIPASTSSFFYVYAEHEPLISVDGSSIRGVNEEATSGFPVTFNNDTVSRPGAHSTFNTNSGSNQYVWNFGEGDGNITVNIGSGSAGDTGVDRSNTFNLSSTQQNNGTTGTFTTTLTINNGNSNSPFSTNLNIIVEPDVRANVSATADTVSDKTGDTALDLYDFTDLSGNNRASVTFTNTSQNNDDNEYDFFNDSSDVLSVTEASNGAGSTSATLTKDFSGTAEGNFTTDFRVTGTPDTIHQSDSETITFTMNAVPTAPSNLSAFTLTLSDAAQFTNTPKLAASFDDNTSTFATLSAGDSLNTTTARRYTSGTIDTNTVNNAFNGASGTLTASINASADGAKTFSTATGETGTFTSLVISQQDDAHVTIGAASYPTDFYQTFDAKITKALTGYTVGVNAQRLEHDATGNTNVVHVVRDDITDNPNTVMGTISVGTQGTLRYISGVPYFNTGSPTLTVSGTTIANLTGQAYADVSDPHEVDNGTLVTGSGNVINDTGFTYADIDGTVTMLDSSIPIADTGVASAYTIADVSVPITSSSVFARRKIRSRSKNVNGTGDYSQKSTIISVFTATPTGLNNENGGITVADALGAGFDDDAVRVYGPSAFYSDSSSASVGDTPQYNSGTNFYTEHLFQGTASDVVAGTDECIIVPSSTSGATIQHDDTDYSTGYLPAGPDRSSDTGTQYLTIAFRRTVMANFDVTFTGTVSGVFIAAPGTQIDSSSTLNGWLDASITYGGSGVPGADTGNSGNGSNGCAFTSGDRIEDGTAYSNQSFTLTLGTENATNATGNVVLVRFKLESGDSITALSIS